MTEPRTRSRKVTRKAGPPEATETPVFQAPEVAAPAAEESSHASDNEGTGGSHRGSRSRSNASGNRGRGRRSGSNSGGNSAASENKGKGVVQLDGRMVETAGMIIEPERDFIVVAEPGEEQETAMRMARIGFDNAIDGAVDRLLEQVANDHETGLKVV